MEDSIERVLEENKDLLKDLKEISREQLSLKFELRLATREKE